MEIISWRIAKRKKEKDYIFSELGSKKYGGRWNSPGTQIIYTAENISLAALELLVNLESTLLLKNEYVVYPCCFDESIALYVDPNCIEDDWRSTPYSVSTQKIGDEWVKDNYSAVLIVPSAVVPQEYNFLLNPSHPDFDKIDISDSEDFNFDPRLQVVPV